MCKRTALSAVLVLAIVCSVAYASTGEGTLIARQRDKQKHARQLTRELLITLLDAHLKQLQENQLITCPLYVDLTAMRGRVDELIKQDMTEAVTFLTQAAERTGAERTRLYKAAQQKIQQIVLRLLAEQERLRMRRTAAELIERVRLILGRQKATRRATLVLTEANEQAVAATVQSQNAVHVLSENLAKRLKSAAAQAGDLGALATDAEMSLRKTRVIEAMARSAEQLAATEFADAAKSQQLAIRGLEQVLAALQITSRSTLIRAA